MSSRRLRKVVTYLLFAILLAELVMRLAITYASLEMECENADISACAALISLPIHAAINLATDYVNRAQGYLNQNNYEAALSDLNQAIKLAPTMPEAYLIRGTLFYVTRRFSAAITDYNLAIQYRPNYVQALIQRGALYYLATRYLAALHDFNAAINLSPHNSLAYHNRALTEFKLRQSERAWRDLDVATKLGYVKTK